MWASVSKIIYACSQEKVAKEYYGGAYNANDINKTFTHPLEIVQLSDLENESMEVVKEWEKILK